MERPMAAALLTDTVLRKVFNQVVDARSLQKSQIAVPESRKDVPDALRQLTEAGLIAERAALIEDFNAYYVTARGLGAHRQLRQFEKKLFEL